MPTVVHFEIPSDNLERTKKFYTELFGWKMDKMPGTGQSEYWTFYTTSNDKVVGIIVIVLMAAVVVNSGRSAVE